MARRPPISVKEQDREYDRDCHEADVPKRASQAGPHSSQGMGMIRSHSHAVEDVGLGVSTSMLLWILFRLKESVSCDHVSPRRHIPNHDPFTSLVVTSFQRTDTSALCGLEAFPISG